MIHDIVENRAFDIDGVGRIMRVENQGIRWSSSCMASCKQVLLGRR